MGHGAFIRRACKQQVRHMIEDWALGGARSSYVGHDTAICQVLRYFLMYLDTRDISIAPHLMMRGMWEPWITMAIARHVTPGMRCIDVGANLGYYSVLLAALTEGEDGAPDGTVLAVEPNKRCQELLARTSSVNGMTERIIPLELAASDVHHRGRLTLPPLLHGGARIVEEEGEVECAPLDDVLDQRFPGQEWDFIKIDVEGMERKVIHGLKRTLDRQEHIKLAVEVTPYEWLPDTPVGFLESMRMQGFSISVIQTDGSIAPLSDFGDLPTEKGQWSMLWLQR